MEQISSATPEQQMAVLANHVLNSTVVYSTQISGDDGVRSSTSASGQELTFEDRDDSLYVRSGQFEARIIRSDVLTNNGVIHVIDNVLLNTETNDGAAASAAESNSAAGAAETGVPGTNDNENSGTNSNSSSNDNTDAAFANFEFKFTTFATVLIASAVFAML